MQDVEESSAILTAVNIGVACIGSCCCPFFPAIGLNKEANAEFM